MNASGGVAVVEDRRYRDHRGAEGHPESAKRLDAVAEAAPERLFQSGGYDFAREAVFALSNSFGFGGTNATLVFQKR